MLRCEQVYYRLIPPLPQRVLNEMFWRKDGGLREAAPAEVTQRYFPWRAAASVVGPAATCAPAARPCVGGSGGTPSSYIENPFFVQDEDAKTLVSQLSQLSQPWRNQRGPWSPLSR